MSAATKLKVLSVSERITNRADLLSPRVSSSSSSVSIRSRSSLISNGANLAPQEISMLFRVLPVTFCQGLFHQNKKKLAYGVSMFERKFIVIFGRNNYSFLVWCGRMNTMKGVYTYDTTDQW